MGVGTLGYDDVGVVAVGDGEQFDAERFRQSVWGEHEPWRTRSHHASGDQQHLVRSCRVAYIMGCRHHRSAASQFGSDDLGVAFGGSSVETGRWFVEEQQISLASERVSEVDA